MSIAAHVLFGLAQTAGGLAMIRHVASDLDPSARDSFISDMREVSTHLRSVGNTGLAATIDNIAGGK